MKESSIKYIDNLLDNELSWVEKQQTEYISFLKKKYCSDDIESKIDNIEGVVYHGRKSEVALQRAINIDFKQRKMKIDTLISIRNMLNRKLGVADFNCREYERKLIRKYGETWRTKMTSIEEADYNERASALQEIMEVYNDFKDHHWC